MNIMFFITPKAEVVSVYDTDSMKDVLEILKKHKYSAVPIINEDGNYLGTIKEGDLLWYLYSKGSFEEEMLNKINIMDVPRRVTNETAKVNYNAEDLMSILIGQNFVPVVDDANSFIGIVKRRDVISYAYECMKNAGDFPEAGFKKIK
ncbi:CBS domain-containing protein [Peptostreptococcus faecalis]|uniref:CBS domain-containing protein n=1 Tax=Peptostreptococcus faecalis TaxID=2045015 RepID=UPI000C7AB8C8|nr:CBS domain-containing protein [Peptostreptococcus faecalis]